MQPPPSSTLFPYTTLFRSQLGGENSGHIICLDKHTTGDGIVSALQVLSAETIDRKSTRLNSSHPSISYAVICLKKKSSGARTVRPQQLRGTKGKRKGARLW